MKFSIREALSENLTDAYRMIKGLAIHHKMEDQFTLTLEKFIDDRDQYGCLVAVNSENEILGVASYYLFYSTFVGRSLYLDDLFVDKKYRGKGVGISLLSSIVEIGRIEGCKKIKWQVASWNERAIQLYKSMGATVDSNEWNCVMDQKAIHSFTA